MYSRIRDIRKERGITQQQMGQLLGTSQVNYSRMERQEVPFDVQLMKKVAVLFCVSIDYLVGLTDKRAPYPKSEEFGQES